MLFPSRHIPYRAFLAAATGCSIAVVLAKEVPVSTPSPTPTESLLETTLSPRRVLRGEPSPERVADISRLLQSEPAGLGAPISDRQAWAEFPNKDTILRQAEQMLEEPVRSTSDEVYMAYKATGTRDSQNKVYPEITKRIAYFTVAECIENKERFLPAIEEQLRSSFAEKSWTLSFHDRNLESFHGKPIVDLGASMRAWTLATADYLLGEKLNQETRAELRKQIRDRVWEPYKAQIEGRNSGSREWWMWGGNNWNAVCHAGVVGSALALIKDPTERAWYIAAAELLCSNFLNGFSPDGYCSEGVVYWTYGVGHYVLMAEAIGRASNWKINFLSPEILKPVLGFPAKIEMLPGIYPAFSDNLPNVQPEGWVTSMAARHVTGVTSPPMEPVDGIAMHGHGAMLYQTMARAFPQPTPTGMPYPVSALLPLHDEFPKAGIAISRTRDLVGEEAWGFAIKAGNNNEFHNHNDVGSYVLAVNGTALLVDPGAENYTARTFSNSRYESKVLSSFGHSVPLVAGHLQDTGAQAKGTLTTLEQSELSDTYRLNLKDAYSQSVPSLRALERKVTFTRKPHPRLDVSDEAEFDSPQLFETALITFGKVTILSPDQVKISDGKTAVTVTVRSHLKFQIAVDEIHEELPLRQVPKRIAIKIVEPSDHASIEYTVQKLTALVSPEVVLRKEEIEDVNLDEAKSIRKEARAFSDQRGGEVELTVKTAASSDLVVRRWDQDEHELTWDFSVTEAGTYGVLLRYCRGDAGDALRALAIDGGPVEGISAFAFPFTGGWSSERNDWREVWLARDQKPLRVHLDVGTHRIALKNIGSTSITLDWVELVPFEK